MDGEQQAAQQQMAASPGPVGSLQLSLSAEQIVLLQAAADNAQRYLEKDASVAGSDTSEVHTTHNKGRLLRGVASPLTCTHPVGTCCWAAVKLLVL